MGELPKFLCKQTADLQTGSGDRETRRFSQRCQSMSACEATEKLPAETSTKVKLPNLFSAFLQNIFPLKVFIAYVADGRAHAKGRHFFSFMMQRTAVSSAVLVTTITSPHMLSVDPRKGYQSAKSVTSFGLRAIIDDQMQIPSKSRAITVKWRVLE